MKMMRKNVFYLQKDEKEEVIEKLIRKSNPESTFYILVGLASLIAALGLIVNNIAVIIGSMLVAPLLYPIIFLGMSIVLYDFNAIQRTSLIIAKIIALGISVGFLTAIFLRPFVQLNDLIISQGIVTFPLFYVAVASGLAATFTTARKSLQEFLPGVAVSIALIPPLINIGVSLGFGQFSTAVGSFQLFLINIFGIVFASIIIFSLMGFVTGRKTAAEILEKEEQILKKKTGNSKKNNNK